ncbi:DUF262 domain-containing protein [Pendulispora rubella]|uniref:DUF262 domain-containing protein n=1 Tax=Pendulispora rubella TaxID=2741070 RepID=A0ABZ2L776_9BACT
MKYKVQNNGTMTLWASIRKDSRIPMQSRDIPQTNRFERIRTVLQSIHDGAKESLRVDEKTGIGMRHASYALNTARILGWLEEDSHEYALTESGRSFLATETGSDVERSTLRAAVLASRVVRELTPNLLDEQHAPSIEGVALAIRRNTPNMSESTAYRRAQTLLSWRQQILQENAPGAARNYAEATSPPTAALAEGNATRRRKGARSPMAPAQTERETPPFAMKPRQMKVKELAELKRDGKLFLPDLQRGFVWNNERVKALHDSLYRGYPIGALLLWKPTWQGDDEASPFSTRSWDLCPANDEGKGEPETLTPVRPGAVFVLDGQQRLTSLFRVIFKNRARGKKSKDPDLRTALSPKREWVEQPFHIASKQLHRQLNDGLVVPAEVLFAGIRKEGSESAAIKQAIEEWVKPGSDEYDKANDRANAIRDAILNAEILAYEIDADVDDDNVVEVFARLNQQGVRLRPSDLAAARLTGSMSMFRARARESLSERDFQDFGGGEDADELVRTGGQVDTDLLVRTALFLGTGVLRYRDIEKRRRVGGDGGPYANVEGSWESAVDGLRQIVRVLRRAGVPSGSWLPYRYALLVPAVAAARGRLHDEDWWLGWILTASLWGHYSSSAETMVQSDAKLAADGDYKGLLNSILINAKRADSVLPDESDFTQNIVRQSGVQLALLVNLYREDRVSFPSGARFRNNLPSGSEPVQVHHIFARAYLDDDGDTTIAPDRIGNLTPLLRKDNEHLKDAPAADYLADIVRKGNLDQLQHHDIPEDENLWPGEHYEAFCEEREKRLAKTVTGLLKKLLKLG